MNMTVAEYKSAVNRASCLGFYAVDLVMHRAVCDFTLSPGDFLDLVLYVASVIIASDE